jgi:biotin operon repressor
MTTIPVADRPTFVRDYLAKHGCTSKEKLARVMGVTVRTAERVVTQLNKSGDKVWSIPHHGWELAQELEDYK